MPAVKRIAADNSLCRAQGKDDRTGRLLSIFSVIAATVALLIAGAFEPLENRLTSLRAQLLDRPPSGQVAIVEIDARSVSEINTWPWSRRNHAELLDRLHSAGATLVAFDVDFSSPSDPAGDQAFADSLRRAQPTILPIFQQSASHDPSRSEVIRREPARMFEPAWVGGVNIFPDADGTVREYPAATMIAGRIRPSIATLLAENDDWGDRTFHPDWGINAQQIPRFSFVDVVKGRVSTEAIAGKRVLIGATAIELGDRYVVPRHGTIPGVVVQALAAESLLQHRALTRSGLLPTLAAILLVALLLGAIEFRRFKRTFPSVAAGTIGLLLIVPVAVQSYLPLSLDSAAILFCASSCIAARIVLELRRRAAINALIEPDTGLGNGRALEAALARSEPGAVLATAAIERFATIRDAIGTDALAALVREASDRIESVVGERIYRIAPDILAWLQSGDGNFVSVPIEAIAEAFKIPIETAAGNVDVQFTIGVDEVADQSRGASRIERALAAISTARAAGESSQTYRGINPGVRRQLSMLGELRRGMAAGEVAVVYQPKLDLATGTVTGAEALVRWKHPVEGLIPPDEFIPLAESTGAIRELTQFVLRTVAADSVRLGATSQDVHLAVNVSAPDLTGPSFVGDVARILTETGADPERLTLEVTESAIIRSTDAAAEVLSALRESGVRLSIDDYGTGQSTLTYVKQLPVHELKIDRSFVTSICDSESDRIMVRSTIDLAHELGLKVVAEGVEDGASLQLLRSLRCDYAQGYFVAKPMPFEQLRRMFGEGPGSRQVA